MGTYRNAGHKLFFPQSFCFWSESHKRSCVLYGASTLVWHGHRNGTWSKRYLRNIYHKLLTKKKWSQREKWILDLCRVASSLLSCRCMAENKIPGKTMLHQCMIFSIEFQTKQKLCFYGKQLQIPKRWKLKNPKKRRLATDFLMFKWRVQSSWRFLTLKRSSS